MNEKLLVAFDVDDTLVDAHDNPKPEVIKLLMAFYDSKLVDLVIWSGGGEEYATYWSKRLGLPRDIPCIAKSKFIRPDIAFDDGEYFSMADKVIHVPSPTHRCVCPFGVDVSDCPSDVHLSTL
jgi:hypothetical protein